MEGWVEEEGNRLKGMFCIPNFQGDILRDVGKGLVLSTGAC